MRREAPVNGISSTKADVYVFTLKGCPVYRYMFPHTLTLADCGPLIAWYSAHLDISKVVTIWQGSVLHIRYCFIASTNLLEDEKQIKGLRERYFTLHRLHRP